ncbi:MAG TPA: hypothetical protein VLF14_04905 [Candidatus Binatia bacterium]|nr:hypothetical protein [Candidatus Binatia bacterium]
MIRTLSALGLLAIVVCACQRSGDRATEEIVERVIAAHGRESKVDIDRKHGSIAVTIGGATKPPGWPSVVPLYPNASRAKIDEKRNDAQHLSIVTEDTPQELGRFYRTRLANDGWQLDATVENSVRAWRGDERLELRVSAPSSGKGSRLDIEYRFAAPG